MRDLERTKYIYIQSFNVATARTKSKRLTWLRITYREGIARVRFRAAAYRVMIDYLTIRVLSAGARARILTFVI